MVKYIPKRGDVVWMEFDPQLGHEQAGRRPALIVSPKKYNEKTHLCLLFPITSRIKNYPFEVPLSGVADMQGVVLTDQLKSFDWFQRKAFFIGSVTENFLQKCLENTNLLLDIREE